MATVNMVKKTSYDTPKSILIAPEKAFSIPVIVGNTGVSAGSDGRKIIKAGTAIGGDTSVLTNRQTVLKVTNEIPEYELKDIEKGSKSQGIILHDVDVTDGDANATMLVFGFVDLNKIETTSQPVTEVQTALTKITFMKSI